MKCVICEDNDAIIPYQSYHGSKPLILFCNDCYWHYSFDQLSNYYDKEMKTQMLETIAPSLLKIVMFGHEAHLINCGSEEKPRWTVNFPQHFVACDNKGLKEFQMFIDYVDFFVTELNGA